LSFDARLMVKAFPWAMSVRIFSAMDVVMKLARENGTMKTPRQTATR
jgi:hypothetical protein